ncbi:hypothetical protein AVEN_17026-1 [Araneus ventricosus]|uniref:Uncharacterized protein n=1 Tax=Araneus ventricosus TaxID=182803 RepID=A0A4Y2Q820_ARAVE|nr:hypothetical protein AVEN_17026-1 [Araneus ventricosus]
METSSTKSYVDFQQKQLCILSGQTATYTLSSSTATTRFVTESSERAELCLRYTTASRTLGESFRRSDLKHKTKASERYSSRKHIYTLGSPFRRQQTIETFNRRGVKFEKCN